MDKCIFGIFIFWFRCNNDNFSFVNFFFVIGIFICVLLFFFFNLLCVFLCLGMRFCFEFMYELNYGVIF